MFPSKVKIKNPKYKIKNLVIHQGQYNHKRKNMGQKSN